jgi:hypothetical protein
MTSLKETSKFALRFSAAPVILGAVRMVFGIKTEGIRLRKASGATGSMQERLAVNRKLQNLKS